jgi:hypothetical protein
MGKIIQLTYEGKDYTLEFTRKSIERMERRGFDVSEVMKRPVTMLPELFEGAFHAHHPYIKKEIVNAIFDAMTNKSELINKLSEMYNEPIAAMVEGAEDESGGNVQWEASW